MKIVLSVLLMTFALSSLAEDTIYRCKLGDGSYVYQQTICSDDQVGTDTEVKRLWKKMRVLSSEGIGIITDLGADADSIKRCQKKMKVFESKVDGLQKQVNKYSLDYKLLAKSYGYLKDCTECRTSAASSCQLANSFLDQAMAELIEY